jgi:FAD/FMN-containing dehydrogenase
MATTPAAADLDGRLAALRHRIDGDVLVSGDQGFDDAAGQRHQPAFVVVAAEVGDVIAAARFAMELGIDFGRPESPGPVTGVLLVTSRMHDVELDPEGRTAWVGAGATWPDVIAAARPHGLTPTNAVRSFEVVTPDGELVRCCRNEHADIFHALLDGTGDGRGVVTETEIELVATEAADADGQR